MKSPQVEYYKNLLISVKRGSHCGVVINAKPIFLLTIFEIISNGRLKENRIFYNEDINNVYIAFCNRFNVKPTPLFKPYLFLNSDGFYHHKWKTTETKPHDSSAKFIRDNIEYAYLDNALWDLLQDEQIRQDYRNTIENFFFK